MRRTDQSLEALDVLARRLVVKNVSDVVAENLFSSRTLVDTNHGDSDRPRCISDRQSQVGVVCLEILANLEVVRDFCDREKDVWCEFLRRTSGDAVQLFEDVLCCGET